ncbi:mitotic fidelity of chromosome transmission-related protein [Exophiala oligosperma]
MAPRAPVRRGRDDVDYSAVGKLGRRTGVTLEQRPVDANGMEEITGIFSSPRKPSPLKNMVVMESVDEAASSLTPRQTLSASRRTTRNTPVRPPASSSPRKAGISGTARRSNGMDIFSSRKSQRFGHQEDLENTPNIGSVRQMQQPSVSPSPEKSPLRDITMHSTPSNGRSRMSMVQIERELSEVRERAPSFETSLPDISHDPALDEGHALPTTEDYGPTPNEQEDAPWEEEGEPMEGLGSPAQELDDEEADQTFEPEPEPEVHPTMHNEANSRRKRKSDTVEHDEEAAVSPVARKARKLKDKQQASTIEVSQRPTEKQSRSPKPKGKQPLRKKDANVPMSSRQEQELENIIEKVKARPGPPRSLYILRRETPADDGVTHTRSGRVSIKPLAYWRNERCVYGGSPKSGLADGARFPLNSIKEIVRTEEVESQIATQKSKKGKKTAKGKGNSKPRAASAELSESSDSDEDMDVDGMPKEDPYAEPWETDSGTLRGFVSLWDTQEQAPMEDEEEIEIAHAPAAIKTREVKASSLNEGPTFRYAKLLSTNFFGSGLVDLPPGGIKRPKNSRKMHMSFYVVKGRVSVTVGPIDGDETGSMNRFSIGKGGFWQVPRGNQYSIENELEKPARVFFSQGCELVPFNEDEQ